MQPSYNAHVKSINEWDKGKKKKKKGGVLTNSVNKIFKIKHGKNLSFN